MSVFWVPEEIDMSQDTQHWQGLPLGQKHLIKKVLSFFATADGIVGENLLERFAVEAQAHEVRAFYGFQVRSI